MTEDGMRPLRAGLLGLGMMGRNHARVLRGLPGVDLVAVADPHGDPHGVAAPNDLLADVDAILASGVDLCVVATPTATHEEVGARLAAAGVPTLIEKPLGHDEESAEALVEVFTRYGTLGCVGHVERYNPALQNMRTRLAEGQLGDVFQVVTRRQGPYPARIADVGVIFDLATHDIDLTAWVTGREYVSVSARTAYRSGRHNEDLVSSVGQLSDGTVVTHLVNWLSPLKERVITVTGEKGCLVADTLTVDLTYYENGTVGSEWEAMAAFRGVREGDVTRYAIAKPEPLVSELSAFAAAVRGDASGIVTLEQGLATVRVAEALRRAALGGETAKVGAR